MRQSVDGIPAIKPRAPISIFPLRWKRQILSPRVQLGVLLVAALVASAACASGEEGASQPFPSTPAEESGANRLDVDVAPAGPVKGPEPKVAASFSRPEGEKERELEILDVLPKDGIPSIDNPAFLGASEASTQMGTQDLVIGVSLNGEHKAYSTAFLSSHEIVNDTVGGVPVAVTW